MDEERVVLLGTIQERQSVDNNSPYVCKAGGTPAWYSEPPSEANNLECGKCGKGLFLVAQVYAPVSSDRTLYVFGCNSVACTKSPGSWRVLRDQVEQAKAVSAPLDVVEELMEKVDNVKLAWGSDSDGSDWSDDEDDSTKQSQGADEVDLEALLQQRDDAMKISSSTTKLVANSKKTEPVKDSMSTLKKDHLNAFPALSIEVIEEPYEDYTAVHDFAHENKLLEEYMKHEEEEKSADIGDLRNVMSNSKKKGAAAQSGSSGASTGESYEKTPAAQRHLLRFQKRISRCPLQCLRYDYGGEPLWPVVIPPSLKVPACSGCGGEQDSVEGDASSWRKHKMLCIKCNHQVGTLARVFSSDKILFRASNVAVQMPEDQSPLLSLSGYPSSLLGFTMWSELILMAETQPKLKDLLQIRRVDNIKEFSTDNAKLNRRLLMAADLQEMLRIVDESSTIPEGNSEAPEDELLALPSPVLFPNQSANPTVLDTKRFWKLIDEAEKLVNFGIASFRTGNSLFNFTSALMRLGVGRKSILQPVAKQTVFLTQAPELRINAHKACMIASAITQVLPKESRREEWVVEVLQAASKLALDEFGDEEASDESRKRAAEVIVPLARSFAFAESFDEDLFRLMFKEVKSGSLDKLDMPSAKLRVLKGKLYQVHLDCELNHRPCEFRLTPALAEECKRVFAAHQTKGKSSSFRVRHIVSTVLDEIGVKSETSYSTETGYHVDLVVPKQKVAIEINTADCYQAVEPGCEEDDPKTLGFVDLKARHLELLGWTVIQLHADRFQQLESQEDRVMHLSFLLEIATCRPRKTTSHGVKSINVRK
ncbi:hypothetical protein JM16_008180 [Phytophthora kernoviae]|uniref:Programmed cell death protein 2 C-terminal domain-containing protein n=3 Tax=Phytophthora kernoviae TaxID=325452 RepID=A0A8T0LM22_9STRA|nr:hypothetical protein JM16_008180 [Phytophthora kernoviae]